MKQLFLSLSFLFFIVSTHAQDNYEQQNVARYSPKSDSLLFKPDKISFGLGLGLDYGGLGMNLGAYPQKNIGFFGGLGYAVIGFGYNAGVKIRAISDKKHMGVVPYALAMYGYNAVIAVSNVDDYNKFFYGPTIGVGLDFRPRPEKKKRGHWSLALLFPLRGSEVKAYTDDLKNNHNVDFKNELMPFAISIGYRFLRPE